MNDSFSFKSNHHQVSYELLNNHPSLKSLIDYYEAKQNFTESNDNDKQSFLSLFINNLTHNQSRLKNNYQHTDPIRRFALLIYILGGRLTYELIRINLPGTLPHLTTVQKIISNSNLNLEEGKFEFNNLKLSLSSNDINYGFLSEDCTGVVRKIRYDAFTNSFKGFSTPLHYGIPKPRFYQTDSFEQLKNWFRIVNRAPLLNIHMYQSLLTPQMPTPSSFVLAAYDGDSKYMVAMRLLSGLFGSLPNYKLYEHPNAFRIDQVSKWPWYYLRKDQLLLFSQDGTHIITKWRNRLLSSTANFCIGQYVISTDHLRNIIEDSQYTKLDHSLNHTDLNPKDKQNYRSCEKIASDAVLNILKNNANMQGTFIYIYLLRLTITVYIQRTTPILTRLKSAWIIVFVCRLWLAWLKKEKFSDRSSTPNDKQKY
ncbi:unnamed protein product, partial [Adineta steineri]